MANDPTANEEPTREEQLSETGETEHEMLLPPGEADEADKPADTPADEPPENEQEQQPSRQLIEWVDEKFGRGYGNKYKDDWELINGLVNAEKTIGRYDDDKRMGQMIRENPQRALQVLQQQLQQATPETAPSGAAPPTQQAPTAEDPLAGFNPFMVPAENAPEDIKQRYAKQQELLQQRLIEQAVRPQQAGQGVDPGQIQQLVDQRVSQATYRTQVESQMRNWVQEQASWLFANGDPQSGQLTPLAHELSREDDRLRQAGMQDPIERLRVAMTIMKSRHAQPANGPERPANPAAERKTDTAPPPQPGPGEIVEGETLVQSLSRELMGKGAA